MTYNYKRGSNHMPCSPKLQPRLLQIELFDQHVDDQQPVRVWVWVINCVHVCARLCDVLI